MLPREGAGHQLFTLPTAIRGYLNSISLPYCMGTFQGGWQGPVLPVAIPPCQRPLSAATALGLGVPWPLAANSSSRVPCSRALRGGPAGGFHACALSGLMATVRVLLASISSERDLSAVGSPVGFQEGPGRHLSVARCRRGGAGAGGRAAGGLPLCRHAAEAPAAAPHTPGAGEVLHTSARWCAREEGPCAAAAHPSCCNYLDGLCAGHRQSVQMLRG